MQLSKFAGCELVSGQQTVLLNQNFVKLNDKTIQP